MSQYDDYQAQEAAAQFDPARMALGEAVFPRSGELKRLRTSKRESQEKFWARFGVTQSSGSRFETGLGIPPPVALLVKLYVEGKLSDADLLG
jgi:DNA-binding transcriptional regulator YiaG